MREEILFQYYSLLVAVRAGVATNRERRRVTMLAELLRRDFVSDLHGLAESEFIEEIGIKNVMAMTDARRLARA